MPQLILHIPRASLPVHLGGALEIDHSSWLAQCYSMTNREDELVATIAQSVDQQQQGQQVSEYPRDQTENNDQVNKKMLIKLV